LSFKQMLNDGLILHFFIVTGYFFNLFTAGVQVYHTLKSCIEPLFSCQFGIPWLASRLY